MWRPSLFLIYVSKLLPSSIRYLLDCTVVSRFSPMRLRTERSLSHLLVDGVRIPLPL